MNKLSDTPETDSRTYDIDDYVQDVYAPNKNQPCRTVVPSTFARKLERSRNKLLREIEVLKRITKE